MHDRERDPTRLDAKKEEIMQVQKRDKDTSDILPQVVRELILHDRGNSIFLSDSFANLPSPVNESQTIKKLFKAAKEKSGKANESGKVVKEIKFSNKKDEDVDEAAGALDDESIDRKKVSLHYTEIDNIVFGEDSSRILAVSGKPG